jgi:hypothetical protein
MGRRERANSTIFAALLILGGSAPAWPAEPVTHTFDWVEPALTLDVEPGRRTARIAEALERIPDCIHERMRLVGARMTVIGTRAPRDHPLEAQADKDFLLSGWRLLAYPFVRVQGQTYQLAQEAFVRRGGRGPLGRSRLFTRWVPLTGRGEETALHEYGHLVSGALALRSSTELFVLWARHSPDPITDTVSIRSEGTKQEEWLARGFERFYRSEKSRSRLPEDIRSYFQRLESDMHRGRYDPRLLERARLSSRNPQLARAREIGQQLLPGSLAGELRQAGAWGLGYFGQLWYTIQSESMRAEKGSAFELLERRRQELVRTEAVARAEDVHLRETCGDVSAAPICESVRRNRSRVEIRHPCLGPPIQGCVISYGPGDALIAERGDDGGPPFPWLSVERHREIALGRERQRAASTTTGVSVEDGTRRPNRSPGGASN